jgi:hypothetical protein
MLMNSNGVLCSAVERETWLCVPELDLDTARRGGAVKLASSRQNPGVSRSRIGFNFIDGIAIRRRVQNIMQR